MEPCEQVPSIHDDVWLQSYICLRESNFSRDRLNHWLALFFSSYWAPRKDRGTLTVEAVTVITCLVKHIEYTGVSNPLDW